MFDGKVTLFRWNSYGRKQSLSIFCYLFTHQLLVHKVPNVKTEQNYLPLPSSQIQTWSATRTTKSDDFSASIKYWKQAQHSPGWTYHLCMCFWYNTNDHFLKYQQLKPQVELNSTSFSGSELNFLLLLHEKRTTSVSKFIFLCGILYNCFQNIWRKSHQHFCKTL